MTMEFPFTVFAFHQLAHPTDRVSQECEVISDIFAPTLQWRAAEVGRRTATFVTNSEGNQYHSPHTHMCMHLHRFSQGSLHVAARADNVACIQSGPVGILEDVSRHACAALSSQLPIKDDATQGD